MDRTGRAIYRCPRDRSRSPRPRAPSNRRAMTALRRRPPARSPRIGRAWRCRGSSRRGPSRRLRSRHPRWIVRRKPAARRWNRRPSVAPRRSIGRSPGRSPSLSRLLMAAGATINKTTA